MGCAVGQAVGSELGEVGDEVGVPVGQAVGSELGEVGDEVGVPDGSEEGYRRVCSYHAIVSS